MYLNKKLRIVTTALVVTMVLPASAAVVVRDSTKSATAINVPESKDLALMKRLEEIKELNKLELTRVERKNLRKEVRQIKREMKDSSRGVYLSIGAIIIIILLLILIL